MNDLLSMLLSLHSGFITICFLVFNTLIFIVVAKKILDYVLTKDLDKSADYALITGCDTGFGNSCAYELNKKQIHVFAACLTDDAVKKFNDDGNFKGTAFILDVTQDDDVAKAKEMIEKQVGDKGLWCLYNNAGIGGSGPIEWVTVDDLKRTVEVNLWGAVRVTKAMLPLIKRARGRIVNTTSMYGRVAFGYTSAYHISKYAFEAFSDSLRYEMDPWGVSVHIIEPGFMRTSIMDRSEQQITELWGRQTEEMKEAYGEGFLRKKVAGISKIKQMMGDPKQVLEAYLHAGLSTRPCLRYVIGADAWFMLFTLGTLPTFVGDAMVKYMLKPVLPEGKGVRSV